MDILTPPTTHPFFALLLCGAITTVCVAAFLALCHALSRDDQEEIECLREALAQADELRTQAEIREQLQRQELDRLKSALRLYESA